MSVRTALALGLVVAGAIACTHLTDFGRFTFGGDDLSVSSTQDASSGDLSSSQPDLLVDASTMATVDLAGALTTVSHGLTCMGVPMNPALAMTPGAWSITTSGTPTIQGPMGTAPVSGRMQTTTGGAPAAVFCFDSFTIKPGATVTVTGATAGMSAGLVIIAPTIDIEGTLQSPGGKGDDGAGNDGLPGVGGAGGSAGGQGGHQSTAGSPGQGVTSAGRGGPINASPMSSASASGGGGGGGIHAGGNGGVGVGANSVGMGGAAPWPNPAQNGAPFAAQGGGGGGGAAGSTLSSVIFGGGGGGAGGTIQLSAPGASGSIKIGSTAIIDLVGGAGGTGDYAAATMSYAGGGGGGGAGGMLWLEAQTVTLSPACISVLGGTGGTGGGSGATHPVAGSSCPFGWTAGSGTSPGGTGDGDGNTSPGNGVTGASTPLSGGGGGGGAAGLVVVRSSTTISEPAMLYPTNENVFFGSSL